jgi:hypothetical protein
MVECARTQNKWRADSLVSSLVAKVFRYVCDRCKSSCTSHKTAQTASNPLLATAISMWQCASLDEQIGKSHVIAE